MRRKAAQSKRVTAAAICVVAGWLALVPPWGEGLRLLSYELPFLVRKPVRPDGAVILYMDDDSHVKLNGGTNWFRPWDRNQHAELIRKLAPLRPKLIVFDILFDAASTPETDRQFVDAIVQNGKVVAAGKLTPNVHEGEIIGFKVTKPFDSSIPWGVAETAADDKMVRQDFRDNVTGTPSLALKAAQLSGVNLPRDPYAARWISYYGPPGTIPFHSYYEAISNQLSSAEISNKVVFVGAKYNIGWTGGKGTDDFRTPFTRSSGLKSPGVEVVATTYLNLLRRDWLVEIPRWSELLLLIVTGLAIAYGCATRPPGKAVLNGLLLFLLLAAIASLLMWTTGVWFAWLIPGLVQIPVALAFAFAAYASRLHLEKQLLERQLALHDSTPSPRPAGTPGSSPVPLARPAEFYVEPALANSTAAALAAVTAPQRTAPIVPDHTLIRKIGQGAYGEVWVARDIIGSYQAAKIVYETRFGETIPFEREFRGIQKFTPISRTNDSFVQILHVGRSETGGYFYYLMELADDAQNGAKIDPATYVPKTLARELSLHGRVPPQRCLEWALELASALERLHQHGLIHRDVKPSNIIFIRGRPKLADIGLVTDIASTGKDVTMLGTQGFIAPEGPGTPGADVYSLGKVLYEALTGLDRANFPELPTLLLAETGDLLILELNRIILKACEPEPAKRYKSAADLHLDLLKVRANARTETAKP